MFPEQVFRPFFLQASIHGPSPLPPHQNTNTPHVPVESLYLPPTPPIYCDPYGKKPSQWFSNALLASIENATRPAPSRPLRKRKRCRSLDELFSTSPKHSTSTYTTNSGDYIQWKKDYHNAIEKKRRDNIKGYIDQMKSILLEDEEVTSNSDKLSTLTAAVDYLKKVQSSQEVQEEPATPPSCQFSLLMTNVINGFSLTFRSSNFIIVSVTDGVEALMGWRPSQMIGQDLRDYLHHLEVDKFNEGHRKCLSNYLSQSEPSQSNSYTFVYKMQSCQAVISTVLFTGRFKVIPIQGNHGPVEDVCFSAILKIIA